MVQHSAGVLSNTQEHGDGADSDSLGVAHAVQHHLATAAGRIAVVKELVKHPVVHVGGQVAHEEREHLAATAKTQRLTQC